MNRAIEMALKRERRNRSIVHKVGQIHDKPSENASIIVSKVSEKPKDEPKIVVKLDESVQEPPKKITKRKRTTKKKADESSEG